MNFLKFAITGLLILMPLTIMNQQRITEIKGYEFHKNQVYDALEDATSDAVWIMKEQARRVYDGEQVYQVEIADEAVVEAFFRSMEHRLDYYGNESKAAFKEYVPLLVLIGYDGITSYYKDLVTHTDGTMEEQYLRHPKEYFQMTEGEEVIYLTLSNQITVYNPQQSSVLQMHYSDHEAFESYTDQEFEAIRNDVVISTIKRTIVQGQTRHEELGRLDQFLSEDAIPDWDSEIFGKAADDLGLLVLLDRYPVAGKTISAGTLHNAGIIKDIEPSMISE